MGRSRSRAVEEELARSLRAREWERLSGQSSAADFAEEVDWAASALAVADDALAADERPPRTARRRRG